jgi:NTE family protein
MKTAFVLGGGGVLGAYEIGMLQALAEACVRPDVVVGTSVGAINGAFVAADPDGAAAWLAEVWQGDAIQQAFSETILGQVARLARSGTHLHSIEPLRQMLEQSLPGSDFTDLRLPFQCVAASIDQVDQCQHGHGEPAPPAVLQRGLPGDGARASRAASAEIRAQAPLPPAAAAQATDRAQACRNARRAVTTVVVYHGSRASTW